MRRRAWCGLGVCLCVGCHGGDPLSGTQWQSMTIPGAAQLEGVVAMTYTMSFASDGTFSGTIERTYGPSAMTTPGCVATSALSGGQWTDNLSFSADTTFTVTGVRALTRRSACTSPGDNTSGVEDSALEIQFDGGSSSFTIHGSTMTARGDSGLPYDPITMDMTFSRQ